MRGGCDNKGETTGVRRLRQVLESSGRLETLDVIHNYKACSMESVERSKMDTELTSLLLVPELL